MGLKILLTQPLFSSQELFGKYKPGNNANTFIFGQAYLAAVARKAGHDITVLDPFHDKTTPDKYSQFLERNQFDVIGCTVYTLTFELAKELFSYSRKALPHACLVAGGTHPTSLPEKTLQDINSLDIVVYGEGEITFIELLGCIRDKKNFNFVKGIAYRNKSNGEIIKNPPRELIKNLDDLPLPAYDLFPMKDYIPPPNLVRRYPTITLQISRGCPHRCAFCQFDIALGKKYRHRSVEKIIDELIFLKDRYKIRGIVFRDSTMTINIAFLKQLCQAMIDSKIDLAWMCYSRTDVIARHHDELLPLMKRAGCWQIGYGCESANQKSLDILQKGTTVEDNIKAVTETLKKGLMCSTTWIICLPGETAVEAWQTVELACKLSPHLAKFFLPTPFPNTTLEDICREDGGLKPIKSYKQYSMISPHTLVYANPQIGEKTMLKMIKKAYRKFYTKPNVLLRNFSALSDWDMVKKYWQAFRMFM